MLDNVEHLLPGAAAEVATPARPRRPEGARDEQGAAPRQWRAGLAGTVARRARRGRALHRPRARQSIRRLRRRRRRPPSYALRLDDLPLAIELAAGRAGLFSTDELLERLSQRLDLLQGDREADPRQQTLRATIDWSYDLLPPDEQRLFRSLLGLRRGLHVRSGRGRSAAPTRTRSSLSSTRALLRKRATRHGLALLDARDDPRVRPRAARRGRRSAASPAPPRPATA